MQILNLGSWIKTSEHPDIVNIDWSFYLRLRRNPLGRRIAPRLLNGVRRERFEAMPDNVLVHDLAKGIPFGDGSVDAVYHSHLLEHLDRPVAAEFMTEVRRVLKPGGVQRVVVPDLEKLCRDVLDDLERTRDLGQAERAEHDRFVAELIEQSVRRGAYGMKAQTGPLRWLEQVVVGDARRRGETHQWLYDWANLSALLESGGFEDVERCDFKTSRIPGWADYGLDFGEDGTSEYKPGSLYVEGRRPH